MSEAVDISRKSATKGAFDTLRAEIEQLASLAAASHISTRPLAIEESSDGPLRIWHDSDGIRVFTIDGAVMVSLTDSAALEWWPDWKALRNDQARAIGSALMSAAADSEVSR